MWLQHVQQLLITNLFNRELQAFSVVPGFLAMRNLHRSDGPYEFFSPQSPSINNNKLL